MTLNGQPIENHRAYLAQTGDVLALPMAKAGARAYIAFAGGLDIEEVMGSRSTFLKGGVGGLDGRAIREGGDTVPHAVTGRHGSAPPRAPPAIPRHP